MSAAQDIARSKMLPAAAPAATSSTLQTVLWMTPILTATVLSKIAVPPFGAQGISIALPVLLAATALGCLAQQFEIDVKRFVLGALTLSFLGITQLLKTDVFSLSSLVLLVAVHLPLLLRFRKPLADMSPVLGFFLGICGMCAVLSILQFGLQSVVESRWLFPLDSFLPEAFRVQNFNAQATLEYGSTVLRSTGVFMMEPSYLSQLLAVAVVVELVTRSRWWLLLIFVAGMLVSYSGTGFMVLALCVPLVLMAQRRWTTILAGVVTAVVFLAVVQSLGRYLHLDTLVARAGEFNATGSSGFARFVGGFYLFEQFLWQEPVHALLGLGAGTFKDYAPLAHYPVAEMPLFKMVLEFGLFGAALYFTFLFFCLSSSMLPASVALAVGSTFLLNGLYIPFSHALALSLLVWTSTPRLAASRASPSPEQRSANSRINELRFSVEEG